MAVPASVCGAFSIAYLQSFLNYPATYPHMKWWALGLCFGLGVPLGDWCKSRLKRLRGIPPGGKWWVEKIDFLVMSFLSISLSFGMLPMHYYAVPLVFMFMVHGPGNRFSHKHGLRNSPH